jgi:hypothetical protein
MQGRTVGNPHIVELSILLPSLGVSQCALKSIALMFSPSSGAPMGFLMKILCISSSRFVLLANKYCQTELGTRAMKLIVKRPIPFTKAHQRRRQRRSLIP